MEAAKVSTEQARLNFKKAVDLLVSDRLHDVPVGETRDDIRIVLVDARFASQTQRVFADVDFE